ncbi:CoA pyrophosphatase [Candidatus Binatia bacterium]|nr:CoA pyrophosphatase [Candidatus Binatia bacterium]
MVAEPATIDDIRHRLSQHRPVVVDDPESSRAAVALVLREGSVGVEFIAIHRAHRHGDPWSGHMALPGGRQHRTDGDLVATAARETREEVGVDLKQDASVIGTLDDLRAVGRRVVLDLVIRPIVYAVSAEIRLVPSPIEVQSAFWIPLASLRRPEAHGTYRPYGPDTDYPAFLYRGHTIWGLTHRILWNFFEVMDLSDAPVRGGGAPGSR